MDYKNLRSERLIKKDNVAEKKCEQFLKEKKVYFYRFGFDCWDVPYKDFMKLPTKLRNTPDYMCIGKTSFLLECKGFKNTLKIKEEDLKGYKFWKDIASFFFFFYDCNNNKNYFMSFKKLYEKIELAETGVYPDNNKKYYKVIL